MRAWDVAIGVQGIAIPCSIKACSRAGVVCKAPRQTGCLAVSGGTPTQAPLLPESGRTKVNVPRKSVGHLHGTGVAVRGLGFLILLYYSAAGYEFTQVQRRFISAWVFSVETWLTSCTHSPRWHGWTKRKTTTCGMRSCMLRPPSCCNKLRKAHPICNWMSDSHLAACQLLAGLHRTRQNKCIISGWSRQRQGAQHPRLTWVFHTPCAEYQKLSK